MTGFDFLASSVKYNKISPYKYLNSNDSHFHPASKKHINFVVVTDLFSPNFAKVNST